MALTPEALVLATPGFDALAAALALATLSAAADGFTAEEVAALLAVADGLVVAELLDLLKPVDLVVVEDVGLGVAAALAVPATGLFVVEATLFVVEVVLGTEGLGLALEEELALDGCLDTVGLLVALDLVAGGRGVADEVGRFGGSVLVSAGLGLDGMVLGTAGFAVGLVGPFSAGLAASGFLSVPRAVVFKGLVGRLAASVGLTVSDVGFTCLLAGLLVAPKG